MKKLVLLLMACLLVLVPLAGCGQAPLDDDEPIGMAVEFMSHAACAYIAQDMGWYEEEGLNLTAYESYATGMALAAALARDDIQVAYICLVPAINVYANSGVDIKVVAGTHEYGYSLVVDPEVVETVYDLENPDVRIGCVREGGAVDVMMHKTIDAYGLDEDSVLANVQRMNPQKLALAVSMGQLDAAFIPEQWATMTEESGFETLLLNTAKVRPPNNIIIRRITFMRKPAWHFYLLSVNIRYCQNVTKLNLIHARPAIQHQTAGRPHPEPANAQHATELKGVRCHSCEQCPF